MTMDELRRGLVDRLTAVAKGRYTVCPPSGRVITFSLAQRLPDRERDDLVRWLLGACDIEHDLEDRQWTLRLREVVG